MKPYRFVRAAEVEMAEAAVYYEEKSPRLGADFLGEVNRVLNVVRRHPQASPTIRGHIRAAQLVRFPFSLLYAFESDEVVVLAVAHHRRRPGYWKSR